MSEEFSNDGMLDVYLFENEQLLENLQNIVLEQKDAESFDEDGINEIFRIMHTIKGSSGIMMFDNITKVSHKLEDVFYYLRESKPKKVPHLDLVEHVLTVADFITAEMNKIKDGETADGDATVIVNELEDFLENIKNGVVKEGKSLPPENVAEKISQFYIAPVATESSKFYRIIVSYHEETEMVNIRAYTAVYALKDIAEDLLYSPDDIVANEESCKIIMQDGFKMLLQTQSSEDEIIRLIDGSGVVKIDIVECSPIEYQQGFDFTVSQHEEAKDDKSLIITGDNDNTEGNSIKVKPKEDKIEPGDFVIQSKSPGKPKQLAKHTKNVNKQSFISVNVDKMDMLMDLIGELVIAEAVVMQNPDLAVPGLELTNFRKAAGQMSKISSDLQDVIMSMRMMPLTNTFQKMNRIVFDVSRKLGKDIDLEEIGETTEVDKNIIEHISDPLMHLIRNAVDHGVETPKERKAAGKDPKAHITLQAKNEGGKVWISVADDGKGMNRTQILNKARQNGLLDKRDENKLSDKEVFQFITYPGFSTKEKVTEYSGRGVGMDVVVKNIQAIGGTLDIESVEGSGSTFTMKIPLTLAIIDGTLMQIGKSIYAIETGCVKEFVQVHNDMLIHEPDGEEYVMIRGQCYPVIRLGERFNISNITDDIEKGTMLIIDLEDKTICLFVDKLIGEQEIVVKPMPAYVKKVRGISGCTQLGDGSIALILDPSGLVLD